MAIAMSSATVAMLAARLGVAWVPLALASNYTELMLTSADGFAEPVAATPARWNAWQPKGCAVGARWRCLCPQPAGPLVPAVQGSVVAAPGVGFFGLGPGCGSGQVPPSPQRGPSILLSRRGECSFRDKVNAAHEAGYCGLLVANEEDGDPHPHYGRLELPDMTALPDWDDAAINIPAWIISKSTGDAIFARLQTGALIADARDWQRKPAIGQAQEDEFGIRDHQFE